MRGGISKGELYQKKYSKRYCKPKTTRANSRRNHQGWFKKKLNSKRPKKVPNRKLLPSSKLFAFGSSWLPVFSREVRWRFSPWTSP